MAEGAPGALIEDAAIAAAMLEHERRGTGDGKDL
jgi:hypothetical protein